MTFADLELGRRLEFTEGQANAAFIDAMADLEPASGATRIIVNGTLAMYAGLGSPLTQTFGLGMTALPTAAEMNRLEDFYRARRSTVLHEVSPLAGIEAFAMLAGRGYAPVELTSVMFRPIDGGHAGLGSGLEGVKGAIRVRQATRDEGEFYGQLAARGWFETPEVQPFILGFARISIEKATCMIAELDEEPIACGAVFIWQHVALLAGACTVPEGRRKGAQLALLDARLRYAATIGCNLAMMGAAPGSASQRNAERHGFRIAYTRVKWKL